MLVFTPRTIRLHIHAKAKEASGEGFTVFDRGQLSDVREASAPLIGT